MLQKVKYIAGRYIYIRNKNSDLKSFRKVKKDVSDQVKEILKPLPTVT